MKDAVLSELIDRLHQILMAQTADFDRLLSELGRGEAAVRQADVQGLLEICREERGTAARLQELDRHRQDTLKRMTAILDPSASFEGPIRTGAIADRLPPPHDVKLAEAVARLRAVAEETARRSAVLRAAADTLCRHLGGVIQAVNTRLWAGSPTYGRAGRIESPEFLQTAVDLRR